MCPKPAAQQSEGTMPEAATNRFPYSCSPMIDHRSLNRTATPPPPRVPSLYRNSVLARAERCTAAECRAGCVMFRLVETDNQEEQACERGRQWQRMDADTEGQGRQEQGTVRHEAKGLAGEGNVGVGWSGPASTARGQKRCEWLWATQHKGSRQGHVARTDTHWNGGGRGVWTRGGGGG